MAGINVCGMANTLFKLTKVMRQRLRPQPRTKPDALRPRPDVSRLTLRPEV